MFKHREPAYPVAAYTDCWADNGGTNGSAPKSNRMTKSTTEISELTVLHDKTSETPLKSTIENSILRSDEEYRKAISTIG